MIPAARQIPMLPTVASLLIALGIAVFVRKKTKNGSNGLVSSIIKGGLITGSICFVLGFFGPIIFTPNSNQGPLLGIFITGPLGFIAGLIGGAVYWKLKVKTNEA